jgi:hypothetical protein
LEKKTHWETALTWLRVQQRASASGDALKEAADWMDVIGWDINLQASRAASNTTSSVLAHLISDRMINGDLVNMMLHHLQTHFQLDPLLRNQVIIADLHFMHDLEKA